MAKLNLQQPMRLKANGRRVYLVSRDYDKRRYTLSYEQDWGSGGIVFDRKTDKPLGAVPPAWQEVENFDPDEEIDEMMASWTEVQNPAEQRRNREAQEQFATAMADNPLFGSF